ncbi:hypothetical protein [Moorena sp. SIO3H5]|uniref:hypothetical protein n=1 Tax=Moorena sp. SIO3H5 TaxID=2607834 RepID=UPI0013B749C8|nr:hypothetical protein [Moorena sp. SIO3H5]NEO72056.1 hypothetical protein [Moorena sp. SIO3H5]
MKIEDLEFTEQTTTETEQIKGAIVPLLASAGIGAASGAAFQVASNAIAGKPLGDGVFQAAAGGAVTGMFSPVSTIWKPIKMAQPWIQGYRRGIDPKSVWRPIVGGGAGGLLHGALSH